MPLEPTPETFEKISALSELANTFDQSAIALGVTPDEFGAFMAQHAEARARWSRGGIEAVNQLRVCLTKQALAGSTQSAKVLIKIHEEAASRKIVSPVSTATATTPKTKPTGRAWRYCSVSEAAQECGVTNKFVQNLVREGQAEAALGKPNPVPMKPGRSAEWTVQPGAVYEWILERVQRGLSTRGPKGLLEPPGYGEREADKPREELLPAAVISDFDLVELKRVMNSDSSNEDKKLFVLGFHAARLKAESEEKKLAKIAREDVIKMLRGCGDAYCYTLENLSNAMAEDLLRFIRDQFQIDLSAKNSAALQMLSSLLCDQANRLFFPAIRKWVRENVEGIEMLEGAA